MQLARMAYMAHYKRRHLSASDEAALAAWLALCWADMEPWVDAVRVVVEEVKNID
jgi:hypothetical protein